MPHIEIAAERIFHIFGLPVTNSLIMGWIVVGALTATSFLLFRRMRIVPAGLQNVWEITVESFLGLMDGVLGSRAKSEKHLPLIATIFIFILTSNWLGILPGVGSVGIFEIKNGEKFFMPLLRSPASDLNFTLALAMLTVFLVNINGALEVGTLKHLARYFSFKNPINFGVGLLEFVSEFAKMISFSFRLFGNVFAGEVLLTIAAFLVPVAVPVPFLMMEIFVGFIQALVFAMLTAVFISMAVAQH